MQLSVRDAARFLNVSDETVYRWIKQRTIPAHQINEQYRFNRAELLEWATARGIQVSPEIIRAPAPEKAVQLSLSDALREGGVFHRLGGRDKASVLRAVVEAIRLPDEMDREFLYEVLLAREGLGSTGIGEGIAIPHARNPIVLHVSRPMISLGFLEHPIDFGSLDGRPVSVLFTMICPTVRLHLQMLSRLGFALRDAGFKAALARQAPTDELLAALARAEAALPAHPDGSKPGD